MASPALSFTLTRPRSALALLGLLGLAGCQVGGGGNDSLPPASGVYPIKGLAQNVSIRRNTQGMPLIESSSFHDALFTLGYVHAGDRMTQMATLRLLAQGRLSELAGADALELDRLMRAANLKKTAGELYAGASPRLKRFFEVYARGVNAWLFRYRDKLPAELADSGYRPEYWKPEDSALIFALLNFSLSQNLPEEVSSLVLAQKVGNDRLAWLLPTYPDEPLPTDEAGKLKGISLPGLGLDALAAATRTLQAVNPLATTASSGLAIAPQRARNGKSLLAGDIAQTATLPTAWSFVQLRAPKYQAAGATLPGLPLVLSGFNGKLAWNLSSAIGDNQDLFLEKIRRDNNRLQYLADGKWLPVIGHEETYLVRGQRPIREPAYETRHGALLGGANLSNGLGLALKVPDGRDDRSMDALFDLSRAGSVQNAFDSAREVRALAANLLFADAGDIGWQVAGRYPNRRDGLGLMPSPGWDSRYDWDGFADAMLHPYDQMPQQGWLGMAGQRAVPKGYGMQLSNTWQYPERAERLAELAGAGKQDARSLSGLQYDTITTFAAKLKRMFEAPGMRQPLKQAIDALPAADRDKAREAYTRLMAFDGRLSPASADAALYELFLRESARQTFLDELGPEDSPAWQAFVDSGQSYSAQADHLLGREDSPFWDDVKTPQKEDKPTILARSLAGAVSAGERELGADRKAWQWGRLHDVRWTAQNATLGSGKLDTLRGPLALGGDHTTLNVTGYRWGQDFTVQGVPGVRMIVDFSQPEPLQVQGAGGQSGNPASPYFSDALDPWIKGQYQTLPLQLDNYERGYGKQRVTLTPGK